MRAGCRACGSPHRQEVRAADEGLALEGVCGHNARAKAREDVHEVLQERVRCRGAEAPFERLQHQPLHLLQVLALRSEGVRGQEGARGKGSWARGRLWQSARD